MRVDKFIFPIDFVILYMDPDVEVLLILGSPFFVSARVFIDVREGTLVIRVRDKSASFDVYRLTKYSIEGDDECFYVDVCIKDVDYLFDLSCEKNLYSTTCDFECPIEHDDSQINNDVHELHELFVDLICVEDYFDACDNLYMCDTTCVDNVNILGGVDEKMVRGDRVVFEEYWEERDESECEKKTESETKSEEERKNTGEKKIEGELKLLPEQLDYAYLGEDSTNLVVISARLSPDQKEKLVGVLRENREAIGWKLTDLKGISPTICTHKLLPEEGAKPNTTATKAKSKHK